MMPKTRKNDQWLTPLEEMRDEEERDSNKYMVYNKAINSLKKETKEFHNPEALMEVKFIGPGIIARLKRVVRDSGGMSEIPSNLPSPVKRKRATGTTSSSASVQQLKGHAKQAKQQLFMDRFDDDDETPFLANRRTSVDGDEGLRSIQSSAEQAIHRDAPPAFLPPNPPQIYQQHLNSTPQIPAHHDALLNKYTDHGPTHAYQPHQGQAELHHVPNNMPAPPLVSRSIPALRFYYIASDLKHVHSRDLAEVDIHQGMLWHRICLLDSDVPKEHPMRPHLRPFLRPPPDKRNTREGLAEAWISDQIVEQYGLQIAPGFSEAKPPTNPTQDTKAATSKRQTSDQIQRGAMFEVTGGVERKNTPPNLLGVERKSEKATLNPTRRSNIDKEWEVRRNENPVASNLVAIPLASQPAMLNGKRRGKEKVRGRVSEFAPAPSPVDDFDADLDRQAASQRARADQCVAGSTSHSAELIDDATDLTMAPAPPFQTFEPIVFPADSYDIVMIVDNREVKSHKARDRGHIASELRKKSVDVEQRSLVLGDVLWIAKRRRSVADGVNDECVLDYVLERKRLDDLCSSIKEGRFHEQKFRLSNTCLKVFYLIEEYDVERNREVFGVQIDTARSSVQIVDGFILKETRKMSETIGYLATMHQIILEIYQHKPLYIIPPPLVKRHSYMALQKNLRQVHPTISHLTSYACFERLNSKSANLTSRDLFSQMLLCVKGLSAEKSALIIDKYPTIKDLWMAFREADAIESDARREQDQAVAPGNKGQGRKKKIPLAKAMLCNLEGTGRKHIGPVLSEKIYRLMRANVYEK